MSNHRDTRSRREVMHCMGCKKRTLHLMHKNGAKNIVFVCTICNDSSYKNKKWRIR